MCKESKKQESTTSTSSIPAWLEGVSQKVATKAGDLTDKPFESYTGQRVADFSGDQMSAFQKLRDLVSGGETPAAIGKYTNAPAQNIGTERVVDEGGRLGQIADYMNPHVAGALQPALAKIQEQADAQRKRLSAGATSAGAFGDARHGVVESKLDQNTSQAMGDTASQFYMNAFDRAMGQRSNPSSSACRPRSSPPP